MSISWGEFEEFCRLLIPFVDFERLLKDRVKPRGSAARCVEKDKERDKEGVEPETPDWGSDAEHPRQSAHASHSSSTTFNEMVTMAAQIYGETHRIVQDEISRRRAASPAAEVKITEVETGVIKETLRSDKREVVSVATDAPPPPVPLRVLKTPPVAPKKLSKKVLPAKRSHEEAEPRGSKSSSYSSSSSSSPTKPRRRKRRSNDGSSRHDKRRDAKTEHKKRRSREKKPITAERKQSKTKTHTVELKRPHFHKHAFGRRSFYGHAPSYGAAHGYTNASSYGTPRGSQAGEKGQQEGAQQVQEAAASSGHNYHGQGLGYHGYGYQ